MFPPKTFWAVLTLCSLLLGTTAATLPSHSSNAHGITISTSGRSDREADDADYRLVDVTAAEKQPLDAKQPLVLIQGETRKLQLEKKAENGDYAAVKSGLDLKSGKPDTVATITEENVHTVKGGDVKREETSVLSVKVGNEEKLQLTVTVKEAVAKIEFQTRSGLTVPEGETLKLKLDVVGASGTHFKLLERDLETKVTLTNTEAESNLITIEKTSDAFRLAAGNLASVASPPPESQSVTIKFTAKNAGVGKKDLSASFIVVVTRRAGYITFEPGVRQPLLPNGLIATNAVVHLSNNATTDLKVEFSMENQSDSIWADIAQEGNTLKVHWREPSDDEIPVDAQGRKKPRPSHVRITARAEDNGKEIKSTLIVRMAEIAKFAHLRVKLNVMDQLTAADLYGGTLSDEYYVLMVRMFNDLNDPDNGQSIGTSILAYSSSIEVAVGLEKRYRRDTKSGDFTVISGDGAKALADQRSQQSLENLKAQIKADTSLSEALRERLTAAAQKLKNLEFEAIRLESEVTELETQAQSDTSKVRVFNQKKTAAKNKRDEANRALDDFNQLQATIHSASVGTRAPFPQLETILPPRVAVDDGKWHTASRFDFMQVPGPFFNPNNFPVPKYEELPETSFGEPPCINTITYRPFTFEMMVNTVDRREQRSFRDRFFRILQGAGIFASFITAVAVPGPSSDLPLGLEKYTNLFLPGANELYPDYKEQHRQNIVSQAMKPIEEIPFGSDITRVIFIPKKRIRGLIPGHEARISQICPYFFRVRVAVVSKAGFVQSGTQAP